MSANPERDPAGSLPSPAWFASNPFARISFSRLAVARRCPAWYRYQYLEWHRAWNPPVTRAGHAVQETFEGLVRRPASPGLTWSEVRERARTAAAADFEERWERERRAHEADPNGLGPWDLPRERYMGYLHRALDFHLEEARSRAACRHPRTGRPLGGLRPLEDPAEAWRAVVPHHAPEGEEGTGMELIPGGYFQGQFDLVYDWTGGRRIVDLKASTGNSAFSSEILLQLTAYAFIERELGRGRPEGLEAWFLGRDTPEVYETPDDAALDAFGNEVRALFERSAYARGFGAWSPRDFPWQPAPVPGMEAPPGESSLWCTFCPNAFTCPGSGRRAPDAGPAGAPGATEVGSASVVLEGVVLGVGPKREKRGRVRCRVTLGNSRGPHSFTWDAADLERLVDQGLRAGRHVRLEGLKPWKARTGRTLLFPQPATKLVVLDERWTGQAP